MPTRRHRYASRRQEWKASRSFPLVQAYPMQCNRTAQKHSNIRQLICVRTPGPGRSSVQRSRKECPAAQPLCLPTAGAPDANASRLSEKRAPLLSRANWDPCTTSWLTGEKPASATRGSRWALPAPGMDTTQVDAEETPSVSRAIGKARSLRKTLGRRVIRRAYRPRKNPQCPFRGGLLALCVPQTWSPSLSSTQIQHHQQAAAGVTQPGVFW